MSIKPVEESLIPDPLSFFSAIIAKDNLADQRPLLKVCSKMLVLHCTSKLGQSAQ